MSVKLQNSLRFIQTLYTANSERVLTLTSPRARSRHDVSFMRLREILGDSRLLKASSISGNKISLEGLFLFLKLSSSSVLGPAAPMHQTTSPNPDPDTASRNFLWAKDVSQFRLCKQLQLSLATLQPSHNPGPGGQRRPL